MVICFGRDLFPGVSLHEDLHTRSTHCMQIILKTALSISALGYEKCSVSKCYHYYSNLFTFSV